MKTHTSTLSEFVILPEVMVVIVYAFLVRVWSVWAFTTHYIPGTQPGDPTLVTTGQLAAVTSINGLLLLLLFRSASRVRESSPSLRLGHYAGLVIGAVILILLQVAAIQGHAQFGVYGFDDTTR